jgi:methyl-accepting chemotaxis protein
MEISKANWSSQGNNLRLSMPIAKVDRERRIVSGFATLDNIDRQDDIVASDASVKAFERFRGNIREMHQPVAVGKLVSFKEDSFYDVETGKTYKGVFVSAYVSKGAQDTWEKVLDGTLTGFSIGGSVIDYEDSFNEDMSKSVRVIKDYDLHELSLVDNPANQYANVISIEKGQGGGYLAKALIENVFWCKEDDLVQLHSGNTSDCPQCDKGMQNIGFVETNDAEKADVVKTLIKHIKNDVKEVSDMKKSISEVVETPEVSVESQDKFGIVEKSDNVEVASVEAPAEEVIEKAAVDVEEPETETEDQMAEEEDEGMVNDMDKAQVAEEEKSLAPLTNEVKESIQATKALADEMTSVISSLAETIKAVNAKVEELNKTVSGVQQEFAGMKEEFGKRVDAVEKDTAFRKSGDLGEVVQEPIIKAQRNQSLWGGRFLTKSDLFA